jgi:hypothetical protein
MKISIDRLQSVKQGKGKITARCPACAEGGRDAKGNHLCVFDDGKFACVVHPGEAGHPHRQQILKLVGVDDSVPGVCKPHFQVRSSQFHRDGTVGTLFPHLRATANVKKTSTAIVSVKTI